MIVLLSTRNPNTGILNKQRAARGAGRVRGWAESGKGGERAVCFYLV